MIRKNRNLMNKEKRCKKLKPKGKAQRMKTKVFELSIFSLFWNTFMCMINILDRLQK